MLAHRVLEHRDIDDAVGARDADAAHELADRGRRHAAPAQAGERRHARVVPAVDMALAHQLGEHALRQHGVGEIEPRELVLPRPGRYRQMLEQPIIERPVILEFEGAKRVGYALDGVGLAVREVVGRVDAPGVAGARMRRVQDAVEHGVAQIDVAGGHVDLGPQHARAVGKFAGAHAAEEIEDLGGAARAEGAGAPRLGERAAHRLHLRRREIVDIGVAVADQMLGPAVELLEIVAGMMEVRAPIEGEPAHVAHDGVDIGLLLLGRIGVVEAQMAAAAEFLGDAEIEADRFGVADMEKPVRLRREARDDRGMALSRDVGRDDVADEIPAGFDRRLARHGAPSLQRAVARRRRD